MKIAPAVIALVVLGIFAVPAQAQTSYPQSNVPFSCNASGYYTATSVYSFECRGLYFNNHNIEFFMQGSNRIEVFQTTPQQYGSGSLTQTSFTAPDKSTTPITPGTFAFNWEYTDQNGVVHTGSMAGTWTEFIDWRGWHHPELLSNTLTLNQ